MLTPLSGAVLIYLPEDVAGDDRRIVKIAIGDMTYIQMAKGYSCKESDYKKFQSLIRNLDKRENLAVELFKAGQPVLLSNRSDPFCEVNRRETMSVLKLLRQFPNGIYFQTKTGDGMEEALEILDGKQNVAFAISVTCADDNLSKRIEPGAPPTSERLEWVRRIVKKGYHVIFAVNPFVEAWMVAPPMDSFVQLCRFWDKAASVGKGDYTAGVLMGRTQDKTYWVLDVVRGRWNSFDRETVIRQTAERDGEHVLVGLEKERGSGGLDSRNMTIRNLAGFTVKSAQIRPVL